MSTDTVRLPVNDPLGAFMGFQSGARDADNPQLYTFKGLGAYLSTDDEELLSSDRQFDLPTSVALISHALTHSDPATGFCELDAAQLIIYLNLRPNSTKEREADLRRLEMVVSRLAVLRVRSGFDEFSFCHKPSDTGGGAGILTVCWTTLASGARVAVRWKYCLGRWWDREKAAWSFPARICHIDEREPDAFSNRFAARVCQLKATLHGKRTNGLHLDTIFRPMGQYPDAVVRSEKQNWANDLYRRSRKVLDWLREEEVIIDWTLEGPGKGRGAGGNWLDMDGRLILDFRDTVEVDRRDPKDVRVAAKATQSKKPARRKWGAAEIRALQGRRRQTEFAAMLGITRTHLTRLVSKNRTGGPGPAVIQRLEELADAIAQPAESRAA